MLYLMDHWFQAEGGRTTATYSAQIGDPLRLRFYIGELWSRVAQQNTALHARVLPHTWTESSVGKEGLLCTRWAYKTLWHHSLYALDPGTMIFHHRRLQSVFWSPHAINVLHAPQPAEGAPINLTQATIRYRSPAWLAQKKTFRVIQTLRRNHWLAAVSIILLCGFEDHAGSADVTSIILRLLEVWHLSEYEEPRTYIGYELDEAVEEALRGASVTCAPKRRKLC